MRAGIPLLVVPVGAALDLGAKAWARASLEPYGTPLDFLPFVSLRLTFNKGISFSLLAFENAVGQIAIIAFPSLLILILTVWAYRSNGHERLALSIIIAGALGNLIDRIMRGNVTDFLDLHLGAWHPFVFNLADVWITVGVALLLVMHSGQPMNIRSQRAKRRRIPSSSDFRSG